MLCSRPLPGWRVGSASDRVWTPRLGTFRCTGAKYPLLCQSVLCLWASRGACSPGGGAPLPDLMSPASRHRGADSHLLHRQERVSQEALPMACPQVSGHLVVCLCLWRRRQGAGGGQSFTAHGAADRHLFILARRIFPEMRSGTRCLVFHLSAGSGRGQGAQPRSRDQEQPGRELQDMGSSSCLGSRLPAQGTHPAPRGLAHPGNQWSGQFQHPKQMDQGPPQPASPAKATPEAFLEAAGFPGAAL